MNRYPTPDVTSTDQPHSRLRQHTQLVVWRATAQDHTACVTCAAVSPAKGYKARSQQSPRVCVSKGSSCAWCTAGLQNKAHMTCAHAHMHSKVTPPAYPLRTCTQVLQVYMKDTTHSSPTSVYMRITTEPSDGQCEDPVSKVPLLLV